MLLQVILVGAFQAVVSSRVNPESFGVDLAIGPDLDRDGVLDVLVADPLFQDLEVGVRGGFWVLSGETGLPLELISYGDNWMDWAGMGVDYVGDEDAGLALIGGFLSGEKALDVRTLPGNESVCLLTEVLAWSGLDGRGHWAVARRSGRGSSVEIFDLNGCLVSRCAFPHHVVMSISAAGGGEHFLMAFGVGNMLGLGLIDFTGSWGPCVDVGDLLGGGGVQVYTQGSKWLAWSSHGREGGRGPAIVLDTSLEVQDLITLPDSSACFGPNHEGEVAVGGGWLVVGAPYASMIDMQLVWPARKVWGSAAYVIGSDGAFVQWPWLVFERSGFGRAVALSSSALGLKVYISSGDFGQVGIPGLVAGIDASGEMFMVERPSVPRRSINVVR